MATKCCSVENFWHQVDSLILAEAEDPTLLDPDAIVVL